MSRYIVAVSGGVDSVVLLDMLVKEKHNLVVAHFDHGIRDDSWVDAAFVRLLAKKYELPFVGEREELGKNASEELARKRRYKFLFDEAKKQDAIVVTAHHADDVVETIVINSVRGTGWRGLAVLDEDRVKRPLLEMTKQDIYNYALKHRLEWVEDSTNQTDDYLRNRVRRKIAVSLPAEKKETLLRLRDEQLQRKHEIDAALKEYICNDAIYERYFFTYIDENVATELLRAAIFTKTRQSPTRPQLARALMAIKTARSEATFELGGGVKLQFSLRTFSIHTP